jgi:hypothetical protein
MVFLSNWNTKWCHLLFKVNVEIQLYCSLLILIDKHKIINTTIYWKCENCWGWGRVIQYESNSPSIKKPYNHDGDKMKCIQHYNALAKARKIWYALFPRGNKRNSVLLKYKSTKKYREVPRSTKKYWEVLRSTEKYEEVPRSTKKYQEVPRSTEKYQEVPRSTKKYKEVRKKYALFLRFLSTKRIKVFCYCAMSKTLFVITEHKCSIFRNRVFDISQ